MAGGGLGGGSSVEDRRNTVPWDLPRGRRFYGGKNWEDSFERVKDQLEKWRWVFPEMSFRSRTLIVNNLVSFILWHKMMCVDPRPPLPTLVSQIQWVLVGFL